MGRGSKKKFVDKKNAATFALVFRESSSSNDPGTRVFVRTDGGTGHVPGFSDDYHPTDSDHDLGSGVTQPSDLFGRGRLGLAGSCGRALAGRGGPAGRFGPDSDGPGAEPAGQGADVEGDANEDEDSFWGANEDDDMEENDWWDWQRGGAGASPLPESVRAEILELGFPDDGYDYTQHLRTMGPAAAGDGTGRSLAAFIPAALPSAPRLPPDVKMYDARRVSVAPDSTASNAADTKALMCHISSNLRELRGTQHRNGLAPSQQSLGGAAAAASKGIGGGGGDVGLPVPVEGDCGNDRKETSDDQYSSRTADGTNAAADDDEPSVLLLDDDVLAELEAAEAEAEGMTLDQLLANGDDGGDSGSSGGVAAAAAAAAAAGAGAVGGAVALGVLEDDFVVLASGGGVSGPSREGNGAEAVQYDDEDCKRCPSGHRSADGGGNTMTSRERGRAEGERVAYKGGEVGEVEEEDGEEEEIPDLVAVPELAKDSLASSMASAASARVGGGATTLATSTNSTAMAAVGAAPTITTLSKPAPPPPGPTASAIRGRGVSVDVVGSHGLSAAPRLLDEQFEIMAQKEYADADDDNDIFADASEDEEDMDGSAARGTASLEQYADVLDEFLAEQAALEEDEAVEKGQKSGGPGRSQQALQQLQQKQQVADNGRQLEHKSGVTDQTGLKLSVPATVAAAAVAAVAGVEEEEYEEEEEEFIDPFLSDEEKEVWDCETIVSTYSNLSNHPGRIGAPSNPKRNGRGRAGAAVIGAGDDVNAVVRLVGRLRLPEGLAGDGGGGGGGGAGGGAVVAGGGRLQQPGGRGVGRVRGVDGGTDAMRDGGKGAEQLCAVAPQRKKGETAEERKARKALVKAKAAEARAAKKNTREAFRGEAVRAQRSAAQTIPQGVRLS